MGVRDEGFFVAGWCALLLSYTVECVINKIRFVRRNKKRRELIEKYRILECGDVMRYAKSEGVYLESWRKNRFFGIDCREDMFSVYDALSNKKAWYDTEKNLEIMIKKYMDEGYEFYRGKAPIDLKNNGYRIIIKGEYEKLDD